MAQDNIGDLSHFHTDSNISIPKADQAKQKPEQASAQSAYLSSSIQQSRTESIVLTYAAGLPVLQPPPKTEAKNIYEATAYSVGSTAQAGGAPLRMEGAGPAPGHTRIKEHHLNKKSALDTDEMLDIVKHLISLITSETEQISQDRSTGDQSLRLMLSALALEMLYFSVYGRMSGEEFTNLITKQTSDLPENVKPLAEQLISFIQNNLPGNEKARREAIDRLVGSIEMNQSWPSLLKTARFLSKMLAYGELLEPKDPMHGAEVFMQSLDQVEQTKTTIITSIWQNYNKNLTEFAERMQGKDIHVWMQQVADSGAKSPTEYYAFILAQSSQQNLDGKNALIERFSQAFNQWVLDPNKQARLQGGDAGMLDDFPSSSFIAGSMVSGIDIVREAIKSTSGIFQNQLKESPVADVLFATALNTGLSPDYQAAAALIVALLNNGAAYKATEDALKKGKEKGTPPRDLDFAIKYAKHIIAIVTHKTVSSNVENKEIKERDRLVRLMLSVMALNMLYRSAYGGMTGEEFGEILKGTTDDIHEKIKALVEQLAQLIKANLPKPEEVRAETVLRLMDYVDSKDSIDSMLQSTRILANLLSTKDVDQKRWEVQSG